MNIGSGGFFNSQTVQDGNFHTNQVSVDAQETSPLQNASWDPTCSSDIFSFDDNRDGFLNFSLCPGYALPASTGHIVSHDPFKDYETTVDSMSLPLGFNTYVTPNQALATQSAGSDSGGDDNVWTGSLATPSQGHPPQQLRDESVDNADSYTMMCDHEDECMAGPRLNSENPPMSLIPMQYRSSDPPWSYIGTPSSNAGQWVETRSILDIRRQNHSTFMPLQFLPDAMPADNELPLPYGLSSRGGASFPQEGPEYSLEPLQELTAKRRFCSIKSKPTPCPVGLAEVSQSNLISETSVRSLVPTVGRRRGPLTAKIRESAKKVRALGACAHCRIKKTRCSQGIVCDPCRRNDSRRTFGWSGCLRKSPHLYTEMFCPAILFEHLDQGAIKNWIQANGIVDTNTEVLVGVSSGLFPKKMLLKACEIRAPNKDVLLLPVLISSNDGDQKYASIPTLQYALHKCEVDQVKLKCLEYISALSNCALEDAKDVTRDTPEMIWRSLEYFRDFLKANVAVRRNGLIQKALRVYWIQYALSRIFTFTNQSALTAIARLRESSTVVPSQPAISARVLNRQLKGTLKILFEERLRDVLQCLDEEYKITSRKSWLICFCTNLVLCLVVDQLQNAIDGLVPYNIFLKGEDPTRATERGMKSCQELEEVPVKYYWTMFFGLYKSYNPIKNGCLPDDNSGQNEGEAELIAAFAQMIRHNSNLPPAPQPKSKLTTALALEANIMENAARPCSGGSSRIAGQHIAFRARNSTRHLSKFLEKFL